MSSTDGHRYTEDEGTSDRLEAQLLAFAIVPIEFASRLPIEDAAEREVGTDRNVVCELARHRDVHRQRPHRARGNRRLVEDRIAEVLLRELRPERDRAV